MKNSIKNINRRIAQTACAIVLIFANLTANAQIPANAVNADPSAKAISQVPLGANINGSAVLRFRFTNEATSVNATGQIPPNSVRLTISFPGQFSYTSVNAIPKFTVEDADNQPFGVLHLVNNTLIAEGEVVDLLINVRGTQLGSGTVTFNADRVIPITVANLLTSNDNALANFTTTSVSTLPINISAFTATANSCDAAISWTVATENSSLAYTEVQQSVNGTDFKTVYTLSAGANTTGNHSVKVTQASKIAYYRLRTVDKSGGELYSETRTVKTDCSTGVRKISVVPSIFTTTATVLFTTDEAKGASTVTVQDIYGRVVIKANANIVQGTNSISLNTSVLSTNTYYIKITGKDWTSDVIKVIKE